MIQAAVLGYGTVGSGVVEVLKKNNQEISARIGQEIAVKHVLDLRDFPGDPVEKILVHDYAQILEDASVDIVVEVMGGIEPAFTFTKQALEAGKSVVTSNKALVAKHGAVLLKTAKERGVNFLFEASVGGGIPIIRPLYSSLTAETVEEITGILNGTTNYMLSRMFFNGEDYHAVLKDAQAAGFAEANPEADVEGLDACRKIAILSSLISGRQVDFEDIPCEGISKLTTKDFVYAKKLDMRIKLLASAKRTGNSLTAIVAPFLMDKAHSLYNVNGVFNAVYVRGGFVGDLMFYGQGAGKLPTASAVVSDIVDAARHLHESHMSVWAEEKLTLADNAAVKRQFLVRVSGDEGRRSEMEKLFGDITPVEAQVAGEIGFITPLMAEGDFAEKTEKAAGVLNKIRLLEDAD